MMTPAAKFINNVQLHYFNRCMKISSDATIFRCFYLDNLQSSVLFMILFKDTVKMLKRKTMFIITFISL
jgi:hypothetical protein